MHYSRRGLGVILGVVIERPGRVGVAHAEQEVRHARQHHGLVLHVLGTAVRHAVHGHGDGRHGHVRLEGDAGGGDDEVGGDLVVGNTTYKDRRGETRRG